MNHLFFFINKTTDFSELSMSHMQMLDSRVQAVLMTPGTSGESPPVCLSKFDSFR